MTAVQLTRTVYDGIIAHAREGKPEEICGILRGPRRPGGAALPRPQPG